MRICAAADIHYPRTGPGRCEAIAERMCGSGADVLVLVGDLATGRGQHHRKLLRLFRSFTGPKLLVPGNHDLWSTGRRLDAWQRYHVVLKHIAERSGFHYLPGNPTVINGIGFVGTIGWFDYAFRQVQAPEAGLRVTPIRARRGRTGPRSEPIPGRHDVPWGELTDGDYAGQALMWNEGSLRKQLIWNDAVYVSWGAADPEVTKTLADDLAREAAIVEQQADRWVGVSHFVPFADLAGETSSNVEVAYVRAFLGSPVIGEVLASSPKCRLVLCGHRHEQQVRRIGEVVAANCSVGDGKSGPLLLTLGDAADGDRG